MKLQVGGGVYVHLFGHSNISVCLSNSSVIDPYLNLLDRAIYQGCLSKWSFIHPYGVATFSRLLKNYRSLLQNIVSFIKLFCKRDL